MTPASALLATDLDGTLAVNGRIGQHNRKAAEQLKSLGIPILVVTGRNFESLGRVEGLWDIADTVLFSSGAGLWEHKDSIPIEKGRLSAEEVNEICSILDACKEDYCILNPIPKNHYFRYTRHRSPAKNPDFDTRMTIYRQWLRPDMEGDASQILVIRPVNQRIPVQLLERLSKWSVFHGSSPLDHRSTWIEIFPAGINKGQALARYCRENDIPDHRVLALGNDHNDESMLAWAGYGYVVASAPAEMRAMYTTLPPAEDNGFASAVQEALQLFVY